MLATAADIIKTLDLKPLPNEGGYFRQTYKSNDPGIPATEFGIDSQTLRHFSTAIYYMVTPDSFSALHRIKSDEIFHFYAGDPVEMIQIDENGKLTQFEVGADILKGEQPQVVVPKGAWQALKLKDGGKWALLGTTVAPGFEFEDFELGERAIMAQKFPQLRNVITKFTLE